MDQKLLDALDNIGAGLEQLAESLKTKEESTTATAKAIQSGDFGKQIEIISKDIVKIKSNTEEILKNQKTIIDLSKERESKKTEDVEVSKEKKEHISRGVGTILLIAVAVIAIGTAFKLVGSVDVLSVIGLSLAITIMSIAFEKVAKLDLSLKQAAIASGTIVIASIAFAVSSYFLANTTTVSPSQFASLIVLSSAFTILSFGVKNMIQAFDDVSFGQLVAAAIFIPIILPVIAWSVSKASEYLSETRPMGLGSFFGAIMVSGIFVIMSYALKNIISSFQGIDFKTAALASGLSSIIFVSLSATIMLSSYFLGNVQPIGLSQFFSAAMVSGVFVILSFGLRQIISSFKGMNYKTAIVASASAPLIFTALSIAIMSSSYFLKQTQNIEPSKILNILLLGASIAVVVSLMILPIKLLDKLKVGLGAILKGGVAIVALAGVIAVSSQLLNLGNYEKFPNMEWIKGVSLSLLSFGLAAIGLGLFVTGPQVLVFLAGLAAILGVAGTIVATSKILKNGDYNNPGMYEWAKSTALLFETFAPIVIALGAIGMASSVLKFFGADDPFQKANTMILSLAETIVSTSEILQRGKYNKTGLYEWAKGTSLLFSTFAPIMTILGKVGMASSVLKFFGVADPFKKANSMILGLADTIVGVSFRLQKGSYVGGPTKSWAEGTALAIGAFSTVYEAISNSKSIFSRGITLDEMKHGIKTITNSIIESAKIFNDNKIGFTGTYPSKKWSEGVGGAISSFSPLFDLLMEKTGFFTSGEEVINDIKNGIKGIATSIVDVARIFNTEGINWQKYPSGEWIKGIAKLVGGFIGIAKYIDKEGQSYRKVISTARNISSVAKILHDKDGLFSTSIDPNYVSGISKNIIDFNNLVKEISKGGNKSFLESIKESASDVFATDPIVRIAKRMVTLAKGYDTLATSLIKLGSAMKSLNVTDFNDIVKFTGQITNPESFELESNNLKNKNNEGDDQISNINTNTNISNQNNNELNEKLDKVIELLTNIDNSTASLNSFVNEISENSEGDPENIFQKIFN